MSSRFRFEFRLMIPFPVLWEGIYESGQKRFQAIASVSPGMTLIFVFADIEGSIGSNPLLCLLRYNPHYSVLADAARKSVHHQILLLRRQGRGVHYVEPQRHPAAHLGNLMPYLTGAQVTWIAGSSAHLKP